MAEFTPITTQEEFDAAISARLERERQKYDGFLSPEEVEKRYKGYLSPAEVKKQFDGFLSPSEVEEQYKGFISPEEAAEKDKKIQEYETSSEKMRIALEVGLPADLADRLRGTDEETIRADAEKLAGLTSQKLPAYIAPENIGNNAEDPEKQAYEDMLKDLKKNRRN